METLGISYVIPVSECDMNLSTVDKGILSAIGFAGEYLMVYLVKNLNLMVCCIINIRHNFQFAFVGISGGYPRTPKDHNAHIVPIIFVHLDVVGYYEFLVVCGFPLF